MTPDQIIDGILRREGAEYTNLPADRGGPTKYGVTLKTLAQARGQAVTADDVRMLTEAEARDVYRLLFIRQPGFDRIADPAVRELVIDTGVNHGQGRAARWLQETINRRFGGKLKVDGACGPATLAAVNAAPPRALFAALLARRIAGYADLVQNDRSQLVFLEGWNARAAEFIDRLV